MKAIKLTDSIAVAGQITLDEVAAIAAEGYKVLVNNRPDGEEQGQPSSAQFEAAARAAGLEYHHLPVTAMNFPGPDAAQMAGLLDEHSGSLFAFCRTGTRCANLWVATRAADTQAQAAERARALGFDLAMAERAIASGYTR